MRHYYEIRHVCGHVDRARIEDTDPMEVRRKIAVLSARRCLGCQRGNAPKPDLRYLTGAKPVTGPPEERMEADRIRAQAIQELYQRAAQAPRYPSGKARGEFRHALRRVTRYIMESTDAETIAGLGNGFLRHAEEETRFGRGPAQARHTEEPHERMARKAGGHPKPRPTVGKRRTMEPPISSVPLPMSKPPVPKPIPATPNTVPHADTTGGTLGPMGHPTIPCVSSWPLHPYEPGHTPTQDTLF